MHIYLQENQHDISVFRMVTTHSAHCYNSPDPPFLFSPPSISLCSQMFFLFLNIHFFFFSSFIPFHYRSFYAYHLFSFFLPSSSILLVLLTMSAFPHLLPLWCFPSVVSMRLLHSHHSHYSQSTFAVLL